MRWVSNDVSEVPPQGPEVAAQCPVRAQWDVVAPATPASPSPLEVRRAATAARRTVGLLDELAGRAPGAVVVDPGDDAGAERHTLEAMRSGAPVVVGARLADDRAARRTGRPAALVADADGGYHPVVVTHRRSRTERGGVHGRTSTFDAPAVAASAELDGRRARTSRSDLLALAHHRRLLEASDSAAATSWGGVIGAEGDITWYDLDAGIWRTPSTSEGTKLRSTMEVYDFEYGFRLDVVAVALRHRRDPATRLLVVPVRTGGCASCPWQAHCRARMVERDDVSLLPYASWRMWSCHRDHGVGTVEDLAALDRRTAALLDEGIDLAALADAVGGHDGGRRLADLLRQDPELVERLGVHGVHTVADVDRLDPRVVVYGGTAPRKFAESIDLARARRAPAPALRRRGVDRVDVRRADVEVDLDLENTDDGVYLWGALVTDRGETGLVAEGYRSFITWEADPSTAEVGVFEQLATWLSGLRANVRSAGRTFAVYCYNERAEAGAMRRLAEGDWRDWVDDLVASEDWVDLYVVAVEHLITGAGMGLKHLATIAGFAWEDDDPGGLQSMEWHHLATTGADPGVCEANRKRILTYNRNDVEATRALRDWMEREGSSLPRLESLEPTGVG